MKCLTIRSILARSVACCAVLAVGCYSTGETEDAEGIAAALEEANGGYDMEREPAAFGDEATFDELQLLEADEPVTDEMEADREVSDMREAPDGAVYRVGIQWGQIPGNRANETPRNWSGAFSVNRGAIVARRTIRFEPRTDELLPRDDRQVLPFTSVTLPHHDGVVVAVIDPEPESREPLTLTYAARGEDRTVSVPLADLLDGPVELVADDADNRMIAAAHRRPVDACEHGFLMGRWHQVARNRGRFMGRVVNEGGELVGHVRGIYGHRRSGEPVFFGKYINREGEFRGLFRGHYGEGNFAGRWITRAGERGVLGGKYRETVPGPRTGGHFLGRWAETTCGADIERDTHETDARETDARETDARETDSRPDGERDAS